MTHPQPVVLRTRNKKRILIELDSFIAEWRSWEREVSQITDHPYNRMTQTGVFADGEDNMKRHTLLQERTFGFLNKNIIGHGFVYGQHGENVDRTDLRLNIRVKHRLNDLDILRTRIDYAEMPKWMEHTREVLSNIGNKLLGIFPEIVAKVFQLYR